MRSITLVSLSILLLSLFSCSGGGNDLERLGLKGPVKTVKELQCEATFENEQWVSSETCADYYRLINYDSEGNVMEKLRMNL